MALPIKYFQGELNNKKSSDFISQLDFTLCQNDRVKLVEEILYTEKTEENSHLDKYMQIYFDEKFKFNPSKDDFLSTENSVCKTLESMANYILFADDAKKIDKTEYNFYTVDQLKDKFGSELSVDELVEKTYSDARNEKALSFILDKGTNYKKPIEQNIAARDILEIEPICDYEELKVDLNKKLIFLRRSGQNKNLQRKILKILKDIKSDQIYCKDKIRGTIYFKAAMQDSTDIDYDQFDNYDIKQVEALMECGGTLLTDLGCLKYDLLQLMNNIEFDSREKEIINLLTNGYDTLEISKELDIKHNYIRFKIKSISKKIIKQYEQSLENWYYTFKVRGKYKMCAKCKSIKIMNNDNFGINKRKKDGYKSYCKNCDKQEKSNKNKICTKS